MASVHASVERGEGEDNAEACDDEEDDDEAEADDEEEEERKKLAADIGAILAMGTSDVAGMKSGGGLHAFLTTQVTHTACRYVPCVVGQKFETLLYSGGRLQKMETAAAAATVAAATVVQHTHPEKVAFVILETSPRFSPVIVGPSTSINFI